MEHLGKESLPVSDAEIDAELNEIRENMKKMADGESFCLERLGL